MADHNCDTLSCKNLIPVRQIAETRSLFRGSKITFEIDFLVEDAWTGPVTIAEAMREAGLALNLLRCRANGSVVCRVADEPCRDLVRLAEALENRGAVRIQRWTTVVGA